jgi:hypothetical protein
MGVWRILSRCSPKVELWRKPITRNPITDKCQGHQAGYGKGPLRGDVLASESHCRSAAEPSSRTLRLSQLPLASHQGELSNSRPTTSQTVECVWEPGSFRFEVPPLPTSDKIGRGRRTRERPTLIQPVAKQQSKPSNQQPARSNAAKQPQSNSNQHTARARCACCAPRASSPDDSRPLLPPLAKRREPCKQRRH